MDWVLSEMVDIVFVIVSLAFAFFLVRWILRKAPDCYYDDGISIEYKIHVMRTILPVNPGISIDTVMEALKDDDLSGFHLTTPLPSPGDSHA